MAESTKGNWAPQLRFQPWITTLSTVHSITEHHAWRTLALEVVTFSLFGTAAMRGNMQISIRKIYLHQYKLSEGTLLPLFPLHINGGQSGADLDKMRNYCEDAAETFPRELPWLMSKLLQLCLLESFLPLSLGNFSVTAIKHQLQI